MTAQEVIEKIRKEIERRIEVYDESIEKYAGKQKSIKAERDSWKWAECKSLLSFIESLEQEQPKKINVTGDDLSWIDELKHDLEHPEELDKKVTEALGKESEVDLEKAYKSYMQSRKDDLSGNAVTLNMKDLARHFYKLGLNARKEE